MAKQILIFIFCTFIIASCTSDDKQVDNTTTTTTSTTHQNLQDMSKQVANEGGTNARPGEPGEEEMNRMYGMGTAAKTEMAKRNELRKAGKLTAGFYPEGSERKLTEKDIQYLTPWGQKVMLNEIYARHGMTFEDESLNRHFSNQAWYHAAGKDVYQKLSPVEKQNISFLINTSAPKENKHDDVAAN